MGIQEIDQTPNFSPCIVSLVRYHYLMNTTQHVLRTGKTTTYLNVQAPARKRYTPEPMAGHHVSVVPGESVRLFGVRRVYGRAGNDTAERYDRTFKIGDTCERDSFNLVYTGTIVAIGEKTITVKDDCLNKTSRMTLAEFSSRNHDFDLEAANKRNSEWMD